MTMPILTWKGMISSSMHLTHFSCMPGRTTYWRSSKNMRRLLSADRRSVSSAHGHPRQHRVDETGGAFRHAPAAAAWAEAAARAGEGHDPLERAVGAPQAREPVRQHAAGQEVPERRVLL